MARRNQAQTLTPDVLQLIEQLDRHCLAPDGSTLAKSAYYDLQMARDEMCRERLKYLEAMAVYGEAIAMVEEYQQVAPVGGIPQLGLKTSSQVYESLEKRLVVAEAAQKLRLPVLPKDGETREEEIEKMSTMSRGSFDITSTSATFTSSSNSMSGGSSLANSSGVAVNNVYSSDPIEPAVGGVPDRFLGITPAFLWQTQLQQPSTVDMTEYQISLGREIEARLKSKCDKLAGAFVMDEIESYSLSQSTSARLPERVKLIIEDIEKEEAGLREDLYSADRKFAEYYNVLEQILGVLIKLVKDLKQQHQHGYDELRKTWLCKRCETMNAKLRALEHLVLHETYTQESIPALHKIRKYLLEATEEASIAYSKAATRLREYQGVDPHFDTIARQYQDIVKELESMQWTIHQVEMDLKRSLDHQPS